MKSVWLRYGTVWMLGCGGTAGQAAVGVKGAESGTCALAYTIQAVQAVEGVTLDWSRLTKDIVGGTLDPAEIDTVSVGAGRSTCGLTSAAELGEMLCAGTSGSCPSDAHLYLPVTEGGVAIDARSWSGTPALISLSSGVTTELRALALVDFGTSGGTTLMFDDTTSTFDGSRDELETFLGTGRPE